MTESLWCYFGWYMMSLSNNMAFLNLFQRLFIGLSIVFVLVILFIPLLTSVHREPISALFQQFILIVTGFIFVNDMMLAATKIWSLNPGDIHSWQQFFDGLLEVIPELWVLNSTMWASLACLKISRKSSFNFFGYWGPIVLLLSQSTSVRIKSSCI